LAGPAWPADLPLASSAVRVAVEHRLRAAEPRFGPVVLGQPVAGDGEKTGAWVLKGERGEVELRLELDRPGGAILGARSIPRTMSGPEDPP